MDRGEVVDVLGSAGCLLKRLFDLGCKSLTIEPIYKTINLNPIYGHTGVIGWGGGEVVIIGYSFKLNKNEEQ